MSTEDYIVFLAMPNGGSILPCAADASDQATMKGLKIMRRRSQFGDIPMNFNMLFCDALLNREHGVTHFAMLHADLSPDPGWLDVLIEEMDRVDADIMSTVMAIKDHRGMTCSGIRYPGVWGTRRHCLREIYRLPETFSITDTDEPDQILAISTGCWVARLPKGGWPDKFPGFQNEHKIVWTAGEPFPWFDSEDWIFSDWAASQGLKVYATRKVGMGHQGAMQYDNRAPWGTWETELQRPTRPLTKPVPDPMLEIETEHPIAVDSLDHTQPLGSRIDSSASWAFNRKLFELIPASECRVLDIGCSGGGFVRSILDCGGFAVGIEGSDYSLKRGRAEWGIIPNHLFTADATKPFSLHNCEQDANGFYPPMQFDVITGWEFWEHIPEDRIEAVVENINRHAKPGSIFVGSISSSVEPHHCTAKPRQWWIERLEALGWKFEPDGVAHFGDNLVRGGADPNRISYSVVFRIKPFEPVIAEDLLELAVTSPPSQSWYDEDFSVL